MMMKFKVGDKARLIYTRKRPTNYDIMWRAGVIVTIYSLESGMSPNDKIKYECMVKLDSGFIGYPLLNQLEPILKTKIGSWEKIEKTLGWNPTKEKII